MGELRITYRDEEIVVGEWRTVFVAVYLESGTLEAITAMDREEGRFAARHKKFSLITIVPDVKMRRPPTGLSDKAADMMRRYGPQLVGAAAVISGRGFLASLARSIMSAAQLISRSDASTKTAGTIRQAADWLASLPDQDPSYDADVVTRELEALLFELGLSV